MYEPISQFGLAALSGIRVLDLSRVLSGPFAGMMLGDNGADVWKVEPQGGDNSRNLAPPHIGGESAYYLGVNRNKRGLCVNFRHKNAGAVLRRLATKCDVILENFLPKVKTELGIAYDDITRDNPDVIYCSISGFGQTGPRADQPGFDNIFQGMAGFMGITGDDSCPVKAGERIGDVIAGLNAAYAIMTALFARERTGKGQAIDLALVDCLVAAQAPMISYYFATGKQPPKKGNGSLFSVPTETFATQDKPINLCVFVDKHWRKLCEALGLDDELNNQAYADNDGRLKYANVINAAIAAKLKDNTAAYWLALFDEVKIPAGSIYGYADVFADPQIIHNGLLRSIKHSSIGEYPSINSVLNFSDTPTTIRRAAPTIGEHSAEILAEAGYSEAEISELRGAGVVS